jgi:hypothetical protein
LHKFSFYILAAAIVPNYSEAIWYKLMLNLNPITIRNKSIHPWHRACSIEEIIEASRRSTGTGDFMNPRIMLLTFIVILMSGCSIAKKEKKTSKPIVESSRVNEITTLEFDKGEAKLSEIDRLNLNELARKRADAIKKYLEVNLPAEEDIVFYNIAKNPERYSNFLKRKGISVEQALNESGKVNGPDGRDLVIIEYQNSLVPSTL